MGGLTGNDASDHLWLVGANEYSKWCIIIISVSNRTESTVSSSPICLESYNKNFSTLSGGNEYLIQILFDKYIK